MSFSSREQTFVTTEEQEDRLVQQFGRARVPFLHVAPGAWRPETLGADVTVHVDGDRLELVVGDDWNATTYDRVAPQPDVRTEGLVGTYLSRELGTLACLDSTPDGLLITVGAVTPEPLQPLLPDLFRTETHTVRVERRGSEVSALLLSGGCIRDVRFDRAPGAEVVGFPLSFGGPAPS